MSVFAVVNCLYLWPQSVNGFLCAHVQCLNYQCYKCWCAAVSLPLLRPLNENQ